MKKIIGLLCALIFFATPTSVLATENGNDNEAITSTTSEPDQELKGFSRFKGDFIRILEYFIGLTRKIEAPAIMDQNYLPNIGNNLMEQRILDVPAISQLPALPTGCEITAITMMLKFQGADVSKVQLAMEMPRHSSDPDIGYVGNPFTKRGWTIYPPV